MSQEPLSRSPDLKRLRDEGYFVQIRGGFLLLRDVPYVDAHKRVRTGTLVSSLALAGEVAQRPDAHVVYFDGDFPCTAEGVPLAQISHQSAETNLGNGLVAKHSFSSKPDAGYQDYYEKMTTYAAILSGPAAVLKPGVTPRTFAVDRISEILVGVAVVVAKRSCRHAKLKGSTVSPVKSSGYSAAPKSCGRL